MLPSPDFQLHQHAFHKEFGPPVPPQTLGQLWSVAIEDTTSPREISDYPAHCQIAEEQGVAIIPS